MMKSAFFILVLTLLVFACNQNSGRTKISEDAPFVHKIGGVSLEMPMDSIPPKSMDGIVDMGGKWLALIPYSIIYEDSAEVIYNHSGMWWGETLSGTSNLIDMANEAGIKTMMKPHVWVIGQGWPGRFDLATEAEWIVWEKSYHEYILAFAKLAQEKKVDLFCVGTEFRIAVVKRPDFWRQLIKDVRKIYSGEVTYASNWDNYERITFWDDLDYIGTDAYFPHSKKKEPKLDDLIKSWEKEGAKLKVFSEKWNKQILFTEYGFRSIDYPEALFGRDQSKFKPNMENQKRAYLAFFQTVWKEEWFAGGFLWKWRFKKGSGGLNDSNFTPQRKPAAKLIKKYYDKAS